MADSTTNPLSQLVRDALGWYNASVDRCLDYFGQATVSVVLVLIVWYLVEILYIVTGGSPAGFRYWFAATSVTDVTPGLFLSTFSHSIANSVFLFSQHLISNVVFILIIGRLVERHIRVRAYIVYFVSIATLATISATAISQATGDASSSLGASGAAFGFYHSTHSTSSVAIRKQSNSGGTRVAKLTLGLEMSDQ